MKPIPKAAMPVVRLLRKTVTRPREIPNDSPLRWSNDRCPIGLCQESNYAAPTVADAAYDIGLSRYACRAFIRWWDARLSDEAEAAVDAIWPKKKRRKPCPK